MEPDPSAFTECLLPPPVCRVGFRQSAAQAFAKVVRALPLFPGRTVARPGPATREVVSAEPEVVLSFDVEEHYRIEAAAGMAVEEAFKGHCRSRVDVVTRWLLGQLNERGIRATFFVLGEIAQDNPSLIRAMHAAGHEVACHSWDHRRVHHHTLESFREDVRKNKDTIEQIIGQPVLGYRAPTFSLVKQTAWAVDVLADLGILYDSSIYPVRHDRYGVPRAPRGPFVVDGSTRSLLEFPPATLRWLGQNIPVGGGGYFRLFPLFLLERGIRQVAPQSVLPSTVLYFHPWELDPEQARLSLGGFSRFRTYVGIGTSQQRFCNFLDRHCFVRAVDLARRLEPIRHDLPRYQLGSDGDAGQTQAASRRVAMDVQGGSALASLPEPS